MDDQVLTALAELRTEVATLSTRIGAMEQRWKWIASAALLLIGAVGGPNAVQLITTAGGAG